MDNQNKWSAGWGSESLTGDLWPWFFFFLKVQSRRSSSWCFDFVMFRSLLSIYVTSADVNLWQWITHTLCAVGKANKTLFSVYCLFLLFFFGNRREIQTELGHTVRKVFCKEACRTDNAFVDYELWNLKAKQNFLDYHFHH